MKNNYKKIFNSLIILTMTTLLIGSTELKAQKTDFIKMVEYATSAPSGHNTQPWKFIITEKSIEIHPDFSQSLSVVDPNNRELYISIGCASENLIIAAKEFGYESTFSINTDENSTSFICIDLKRIDGLKSPLFEQIEKRQTNRRVYNKRIIADDTICILENLKLEKGSNLRFYKNGSSDFLTLTSLIYEGNNHQMSDKAFKAELLSWIRFNKTQKAKFRNGLTNEVTGSPSAPTFIGKMIVSSYLKPEKQNKTDMEKINSSSHLTLFTINKNTPENWILLGRSLERFLLESTRLGIANAYMNQPCEVESISNVIHEKINIGNEIPVLLLRIGYAEPMPYSPRKDVRDVIAYKINRIDYP